MKCKDCRYWQGTRISEWGDCYRLIEKLNPHLLGCVRQHEEDEDIEFYFATPFDPNDLEYWKYHPFFNKLYGQAVSRVYNHEGVLMDGVFIQTRKDFDCEECKYEG